MNLNALRQQVFSYGFDQNVYLSRVTQFLNDAQNLIARRVGYYADEATVPFATVPATGSYPWPAGLTAGGGGGGGTGLANNQQLARIRSLIDLDRQTPLTSVTLDDIDRSQTQSGRPGYYALDAASLHLYPTPDAVYNLELRYWAMPAVLSGDADVPSLPADWHRLLWMWAVQECYYAEDDPQMAQTWKQRFDEALAEFAADAKFPSTDMPTQVRGMWDQHGSLGGPGWSVYAGW